MILHLSNAWLFILAWVVQLLVYPSFGKITSEKFFIWHKRYMAVIVLLTLPFMMIQGGLHSLNLFESPGIIHLAQWIGVVVTFFVTFVKAVPIHYAMRKEGNQPKLVQSLLRAHLIRSIAWTVILVLDFIKF